MEEELPYTDEHGKNVVYLTDKNFLNHLWTTMKMGMPLASQLINHSSFMIYEHQEPHSVQEIHSKTGVAHINTVLLPKNFSSNSVEAFRGLSNSYHNVKNSCHGYVCRTWQWSLKSWKVCLNLQIFIKLSTNKEEDMSSSFSSKEVAWIWDKTPLYKE